MIGTWTCSPLQTLFSPDGITAVEQGCRLPTYISQPVGTFSGYYAVDFIGGMVGMFLDDNLPATAPPTNPFYFYDYLRGGSKTDFVGLAPLIGQAFFIGDGLTGTGAGRRQVFFVPPTATRLYLGFAETCSLPYPYDVPGCCSDNTGALTATFGLYQIK